MNKFDFWNLNYFNHPPLTPPMLRMAEAMLNVKLPSFYIELLRIQNGGFTKGFAFPLHHDPGCICGYIPLPELFGIVTDKNILTAQNILDSNDLCQEFGMTGKQLIIAFDDEQSFLALDYSYAATPSVRWTDLQTSRTLLIAEDFNDFIDGLISIDKFVDG